MLNIKFAVFTLFLLFHNYILTVNFTVVKTFP